MLESFRRDRLAPAISAGAASGSGSGASSQRNLAGFVAAMRCINVFYSRTNTLNMLGLEAAASAGAGGDNGEAASACDARLTASVRQRVNAIAQHLTHANKDFLLAFCSCLRGMASVDELPALVHSLLKHFDAERASLSG